MPPTDYVPWLLSRGDIPLDSWLAPSSLLFAAWPGLPHHATLGFIPFIARMSQSTPVPIGIVQEKKV